jgi:diaminohydroxyphosphoribosylaminopyrimidine deaminase/5-amino-6-(5-phosphoribosylamino)uracil reductase
MQRCLELAQLGQGRVAPNPMVGCVIVHEGRIIGEGYHQQYGEAHAEVNAVNAVGNKDVLRDATMYVSLEPCAHHGKTPPCADLIVKHGIREVFIATDDPFAQVAGKGIDRLRNAGVTVHVGLLEQEARELNRRFFTFHQQQRPYIILKWAETHDMFVDRVRESPMERPLAITCDSANVLSHTWRAQEAGIMVGMRTALLDDPSLTVRHAAGNNPIRIVLDRNMCLPTSSNILNNDAPTLILNEQEEKELGLHRYLKMNDMYDLNEVINELWKANVQSILVEGGPALHRRFIDADLWDEARRFVSPDRIGTGVPAATLPLNPDRTERIGRDLLHHYRNHRTA